MNINYADNYQNCLLLLSYLIFKKSEKVHLNILNINAYNVHYVVH